MEVNQLNSMSGSQARAHFMDPMVDLSQVVASVSGMEQVDWKVKELEVSAHIPATHFTSLLMHETQMRNQSLEIELQRLQREGRSALKTQQKPALRHALGQHEDDLMSLMSSKHCLQSPVEGAVAYHNPPRDAFKKLREQCTDLQSEIARLADRFDEKELDKTVTGLEECVALDEELKVLQRQSFQLQSKKLLGMATRLGIQYEMKERDASLNERLRDGIATGGTGIDTQHGYASSVDDASSDGGLEGYEIAMQRGHQARQALQDLRTEMYELEQETLQLLEPVEPHADHATRQLPSDGLEVPMSGAEHQGLDHLQLEADLECEMYHALELEKRVIKEALSREERMELEFELEQRLGLGKEGQPRRFDSFLPNALPVEADDWSLSSLLGDEAHDVISSSQHQQVLVSFQPQTLQDLAFGGGEQSMTLVELRAEVTADAKAIAALAGCHGDVGSEDMRVDLGQSSTTEYYSV